MLTSKLSCKEPRTQKRENSGAPAARAGGLEGRAPQGAPTKGLGRLPGCSAQLAQTQAALEGMATPQGGTQEPLTQPGALGRRDRAFWKQRRAELLLPGKTCSRAREVGTRASRGGPIHGERARGQGWACWRVMAAGTVMGTGLVGQQGPSTLGLEDVGVVRKDRDNSGGPSLALWGLGQEGKPWRFCRGRASVR